MEKNLDYYLNLPYVTELLPIPISLGGGFTARLPQVGRNAIVGDGETIDEAINNLEQIKRLRFSEYLEKRVKIPEPGPEKEDYSGRFVVRIPKKLHRKISEAAQENQCSLNQFITYLLSENFVLEEQKKQHDQLNDKITILCEELWKLNYSFISEKKESIYKNKVIKEMNQYHEPDELKAA